MGMFQNLGEFYNKKIRAADGYPGKTDDFLFDRNEWRVRYLVVKLNSIWPGQKVLLSPDAVEIPQEMNGELPVLLSCHQIKECPRQKTSRLGAPQYGRSIFASYGYLPYWDPQGIRYGPIPEGTLSSQPPGEGGLQLRSAKMLRGYSVESGEERVGYLDDLVIDTTSWMIRFIVIASGYWQQELSLLSSQWVDRIDMIRSRVHVSFYEKVTKTRSPLAFA